MWLRTRYCSIFLAPEGVAGGGGAATLEPGAAGGGAAPGAAAGAGAGAAAGGAGGAAGAGQGAAPGGAGAGAGGAAAAPLAFADTLPDDIRNEAAFRDIKDLGGLAKGYLNAQKLIGRIHSDPTSVLALPAADDEAGWQGVYDKLGRPPSADKYVLGAVTLPEGLAKDERLQTAFLDKAHKAGLTTKQADALYQWYQAEAIVAHQKSGETLAQATQRSEQALRTEWGTAYEQNLGLARQALAHYGDADLVAELDRTGDGNRPATLKLFAKLGKQLGEDGLIGRGGGGGNQLSPTEARQQINALYGGADPAFLKSYRDKSAPGHKEAVAKMQGLHAMAYPEAP